MKSLLILSGSVSAILLCVALGLALVHPGNNNNTIHSGLKLLSPSNKWSFCRGEVWVNAMIQVLFSLSVGFGTLPSLSSTSLFYRDIIR